MVFTMRSHFWHYASQMEIAYLTHGEYFFFLSNGNVFTVQIAGEKCQGSSDPFAFVCLSQGKGARERWRDWYGASEFWLLLEYGSSIPGKIFHLARCTASWQTAACTAGAPTLTHHAMCARNGSQLTVFMPICSDNTGASWILVNSMILFFSLTSLIQTKLQLGKTEDRILTRLVHFAEWELRFKRWYPIQHSHSYGKEKLVGVLGLKPLPIYCWNCLIMTLEFLPKYYCCAKTPQPNKCIR